MSAGRKDRDAVLSEIIDAVATVGLFAACALVWLAAVSVVGFALFLLSLAGVL